MRWENGDESCWRFGWLGSFVGWCWKGGMQRGEGMFLGALHNTTKAGVETEDM